MKNKAFLILFFINASFLFSQDLDRLLKHYINENVNEELILFQKADDLENSLHCMLISYFENEELLTEGTGKVDEINKKIEFYFEPNNEYVKAFYLFDEYDVCHIYFDNEGIKIHYIENIENEVEKVDTAMLFESDKQYELMITFKNDKKYFTLKCKSYQFDGEFIVKDNQSNSLFYLDTLSNCEFEFTQAIDGIYVKQSNCQKNQSCEMSGMYLLKSQ